MPQRVAEFKCNVAENGRYSSKERVPQTYLACTSVNVTTMLHFTKLPTKTSKYEDVSYPVVMNC